MQTGVLLDLDARTSRDQQNKTPESYRSCKTYPIIMASASANTRAKLASLLPIIQLIGGIFMAWKLLGLATNCAYPAMVVLSESMSPAFERGDIILLSNWAETVEVGDIPVLWFEGYELPMVHRAIVVQYE